MRPAATRDTLHEVQQQTCAGGPIVFSYTEVPPGHDPQVYLDLQTALVLGDLCEEPHSTWSLETRSLGVNEVLESFLNGNMRTLVNM